MLIMIKYVNIIKFPIDEKAVRMHRFLHDRCIRTDAQSGSTVDKQLQLYSGCE